MKLPSSLQLRQTNRSLATHSEKIFRSVLAPALSQYARLSGDQKGLGFLRSRSFSHLLKWADELVVTQYATADLHFAAHQVSALVRKYPWSSSLVNTDPERAAIDTFRAAEHRCLRMNQWFATRRRVFARRRADSWEYYLARMRAFVKYVLNEQPDLERVYSLADVTGGASLGVHGDATNLARKLLVRNWTVSPSALPYFAAALCHNATYATKVAKGNGMIQSLHVTESDVKLSSVLVNANKIAFVPKTAKTYRSIAVEPFGNGYLQKGTDLLMRNHLKRVGLDLSDQSRNQELARQGSLSDSEEGFCTIDLTSASDSISIELVRELLPPDWFNFLNRIRSPSYILNGVEYRSNKFCTMGNGFCFPLETLIFASACHAVQAGRCGDDYSVYGDDIIVRRKAFNDVLRLLKALGFRPNVKKTFSSGPFRESCGANWYNGEDVTPFTLDFKLDCLSSMFKFVNLARRNPRTSSFLDDSVRLVLSRIPDLFLFHRPFKGASDTGIDPLGIQYTKRWWKSKKNPWTLQWLELETRPVRDELRCPSWVVLAAALRGHSSEAPFTYRRKVVTRVRVISRPGDLVPQVLTFARDRAEAFARKIRLMG